MLSSMVERKLLFKKICVFTCVLLTLVLYYYYFSEKQIQQIYLQKQFTKKNKIQILVVNKTLNNNIKVILYWTKFWTWNYPMGSGSSPFKGCTFRNCLTTYNKSLLNIDEFDAIIFHGPIYDINIHGKPKIRNVNQRYIHYNTEAPANKFSYNPNFTLFSSFYNWTITYRFDSDVILRYGHVGYRKGGYKLPSLKDVKKKTKLVAWFVSHCNTSSKRELLVKEMQKYIPVDIYGACGNLSCLRIGYISSNTCYNMIQNTYKFYLSFENSLCKEYFTEKLYYILNINVIPVVYGGNDDAVVAPPNSFINVKDFKSVKELTDYLKFLNANTSEYLKYFEWRKTYLIFNNPTNCDLCKKLNEPLTHKTYKNFYAWQWGNSSHPNCIIHNLPPIVKNILE